MAAALVSTHCTGRGQQSPVDASPPFVEEALPAPETILIRVRPASGGRGIQGEAIIMNKRMLFLSPCIAASVCLVAPAQAKMLTYTATLRGDSVTSNTGSPATGSARIIVDSGRKSVSLTLDVSGISIEQLAGTLVKAPIGPIHLHAYGSHDLTDPNSVSLVFPVPFGSAYQASTAGFSVRVNDYSYATGADLLRSNTSFKGFIEALNRGDVVLNIHTNAFPGGEISGTIVKS